MQFKDKGREQIIFFGGEIYVSDTRALSEDNVDSFHYVAIACFDVR